MKEFNWNPTPKQNNELLSPAELAKIAEFNRLKVEVDAIEAKLKEKMLETMRDQGIKKVDTDYFSATYIAPTERTSVDTAKLKSDGLYESYSKTSKVKESVRITFKGVNK